MINILERLMRLGVIRHNRKALFGVGVPERENKRWGGGRERKGQTEDPARWRKPAPRRGDQPDFQVNRSGRRRALELMMLLHSSPEVVCNTVPSRPTNHQ